MYRLLSAVATWLDVKPSALRLYVNAQRLAGGDTAETLGLKDNDQIDTRHEQLGD
jgi:hypothetical protein